MIHGFSRRVIVESPYAGDVDRNVHYAISAVGDCLARKEAPFASHLMYTAALRDWIADDREKGFEAAGAWACVAHACAVYIDLGISPGMQIGIDRATRWGMPVEYRTIEGWHDE